MKVRRGRRVMVAAAVVTGAAVLGLSASPASAEPNDACRFQHDVTLHAEFMATYGGGTAWNQLHWLTVYLQHNQDLIGMGCV